MTSETETTADDHDDGPGIRGLTASQERALPLLASGMSPRSVAAEVGVSWGTLRNWQSTNDRFRSALATVRRELHQNALASILALSADATASLRTILTDPKTAARDKLTAASTVLRHVMPTQSNLTLTTPEDAAGAIAAILDNLETDDDGQNHP